MQGNHARACLLEEGIAFQAVPLRRLQPLLICHLRPVLQLQEGRQSAACDCSFRVPWIILWCSPRFTGKAARTCNSGEKSSLCPESSALACAGGQASATVCKLGQVRGSCLHLIYCLKVHKLQIVLKLCIWRHIGEGEAACTGQESLVQHANPSSLAFN